MPTRTSDARRRDMGAELRKWREAAGLNGNQLARKIGWDPSTVSRLESGHGTVTELAVMVYLSHCGVSAANAANVLKMARETEEGYLVRRDVLRTLVLHESTARTIQMAAPLLVPGLLQTEGYARAVISLNSTFSSADIEMRLAARMSRQELLRRWQPPNLTYFLYEAALRCPLGGNRVMNEQMLHLAFLTARPHVTVRIIPFEKGAYAADAGQMTLMTFAEHGPVLYLENRFAGMFNERADDLQLCRTIFEQLGHDALNEGQSRELLAQLASDYDRPEGASDADLAQEQLQQC
jgi:transcriptional regulator with XRE-family HTH domain